MVSLHRELLAVLEREAEAMVKHDIPAIEKAGREEGALIENIRAAEQKRQKTLFRLSQDAGRDLRRAALLDIAQAAGGEYRAPLLRLRGELRAVAEELTKKNTLKMLLCEQSLSHVRTMLRLLTGSAETGLYTSVGLIEERTHQVILDQQV